MTDTTPGGSHPLNSPSPEPPAISEAADKAKQAARAQIDRLAGGVQAKVGEAKAAATSKADAAKDDAADQFARTARALDNAASDPEGSAPQQQLLHQAADALMRVSEALRDKSLGDMTTDLAAFGRRNPLAFLGGAALAGFALARFAGAHGEPDARPAEPYARPEPAYMPGSPRDV